MNNFSGRIYSRGRRGARVAVLLALAVLTGGAVACVHAPGMDRTPSAVTDRGIVLPSAATAPLPTVSETAPAAEASNPPPAASAPKPDEELAPPAEDVTAGAAVGYVPEGDAWTAAPVTSAVVDYASLPSVATGYLRTRLTYRYDDPAGYAAAVLAPAYTTPAFSQRSAPTTDQQARLLQAQQTSTVAVGAARASSEAPTTSTTAYLTVACTVTTTYRGGSDAVPADWTLRLVLADGQWRVDGVLSTS